MRGTKEKNERDNWPDPRLKRKLKQKKAKDEKNLFAVSPKSTQGPRQSDPAEATKWHMAEEVARWLPDNTSLVLPHEKAVEIVGASERLFLRGRSQSIDKINSYCVRGPLGAKECLVANMEWPANDFRLDLQYITENIWNS